MLGDLRVLTFEFKTEGSFIGKRGKGEKKGGKCILGGGGFCTT